VVASRRLRSALIFACLVAAGLAVGLQRLIDADEGYLLYAAKLLSHGARPYADFFLPQPPVLPWMLSVALHPVTWKGGRVFASVLAASTGMLVVLSVRRRGLRPGFEWLAAALFATTALAFGWLSIVKTYAAATPLLYLSYFLARSSRSPARGFGAGVALALAAATRLYLLGVAPVVLFVALRESRARARTATAFVAGMALVALAVAPLLWAGRDALAFDLVGYHAHLSQMSFAESLRQKAEVLKQLFGLDPIDRALGLQVLLLTLVSVRRAFKALDPAFLMLCALFVLTLVPSPTYVQYFCMCVPFLVELAVVAVAETRRARAIAWSAGVVYLALGVVEAHRHCVSGKALIGIPSVEDAWRWRIDTVRGVARVVDARAACGPVAVAWPGYLVESKATAWPGLENHFGKVAGGELPDRAERLRVKVLSPEDLDALAEGLAGPRPKLWLLGNSWTDAEERRRLRDYRTLAEAGGGTLYGYGCE
jgi:hypothetical protein